MDDNIVQAGIVEPAALVQNRHWFDPAKYERIRTESGHVAYIATAPAKHTE